MDARVHDNVVRVEWNQPIAAVVLDNPPLNILTSEVKELLTKTFLSLQERDDIRVVVLRGEGRRAFCAGANLKEFPDRIRLGNAYAVSKQGHRLSASIRSIPQPVIAAIDGLAHGGGLELALFADLRIASRDSTFALPEVKRGVFPGTSGSQLLPRLIGAGPAKRMMFFGDPINSEEALRIGLVDRVVGNDELRSAAYRWAHELADRPATAVRCIKQLVDVGSTLPLEEALELESTLFARVFETADVKEGVAAFFERRKPKFVHR